MSQKKIKKLRKQEVAIEIKKENVESIIGIREIIRKNWKFLATLLIGVFLLYANSLNGDFVSDDYASIPQETHITDFGYMAKRLITSLSNWVVAVTFGIVNTMPYHLLNLLTYLFICVFAFIFLSLITNQTTARWTTVLFVVLPIHVEAVSWISGKPYLFSAFFILLSLIFFIMFIKTKNKKYFWVFLVLLPLTFIAERVRSIALLLLSGLYLLVYGQKYVDKKKIWSFFYIALGLLVLAVLILSPLIMDRIQGVNSGYNASESIFYNPFFQYPTAIAKYLQLILVPVDLTLYHTMYIFPVWLNWVILIFYLSLLIYFFIKNKNVFFALAFIFLATAPSMAPVKVSWLVAERYMFLGSLGFCLFLFLITENLVKNKKSLVIFAFVSLISVFAIRTYLRNIDWQTNHNLWVNTVQVSPNSHNAWNNIGDDYDKLKQYENSVKGFSQSTVVKPNYADAYHNRANIFFKVNRLDLARESYDLALKYSPQLYQTYLSLTQIDLMEKRYDLAIKHAEEATKIQPNNPQSYYVLGIVNVQAGKIEEAKKIFTMLVNNVPNFKQAKDVLDQLNQQSK